MRATSPARSGALPCTLRTRASIDDAALRVVVERQRIAGRLHDEVSPLLFALSAGVQRAELRPDADAAELLDALRRAGDQVAEVADRLRAVLRDCSPADPADGVPAAALRDVQDFGARTGVRASLRVRGAARALGPSADRAVLGCLRLALDNVERHAGASAVDVTLDYGPDRLLLDVHDDGRGLPADFQARAVPSAGHDWGLTSMARRAEQHGGHVEIDGTGPGTRVRVRLPA